MNTNSQPLVGQTFGKGFVIGSPAELERHDYKGASVEIMLQRQGCSATVNCSHPAFFVEIHSYQDKGFSWEVCYSGDKERYGWHFAGQLLGRGNKAISFESAKKAAAKCIKSTLGIDVTFSEHTHAYINYATYGYENDDVIMSPVHFDPEHNHIIHTHSGNTLVAFGEGASELSAHDVITGRVIPASLGDKDFTEQVIESAANVDRVGFHECDLKRGAYYCMRRYAWLLGVYMMKYDREVAGRKSNIFYMNNIDMELRK